MPAAKKLSASRVSDTDCCSGSESSCIFHRDAIVAAVSHAKSVHEFTRLLSCICSTDKPWRAKDALGKSILHLAASLGRTEIVAWYLQCRASAKLRTNHERSSLIDELDAESGWTALHRGVFQGEIATVAFLMSHGADLAVKDHDGYSPVQLLLHDQNAVFDALDRYYVRRPNLCMPLAFHTWGSSSNYTLGYGTNQEKSIPEKVRAVFGGDTCDLCGNVAVGMPRSVAKGEIHVKCPGKPTGGKTHGIPNLDIVLRKFHTLFLTPTGVFVCGHGQGGRLGLNSEKTCLTPTRITFPTVNPIQMIAAGVNHSVFLDSEGLVYSCGSNEYTLLGLTPPPDKVLVPTLLSFFQTSHVRPSKKHAIPAVEVVGIGAERCHTYFWTNDAFFVLGFNGGQLGPRRDRSLKGNFTSNAPDATELSYVTPRELTEIKSYLPARFVTCSDAAVVICPLLNRHMDMILLHDYEVRRLPKLPRLARSVQGPEAQELSEISVFGGKLSLPEKDASRSRDLVIVVLFSDIPLLLVEAGKHSFWQVISVHGIPRDMSAVYHISLSSGQLLLSTEFGECYTVRLDLPDRSKIPAAYSSPLKAERVPKLWRATKVFAEPGGRSFAAVQLAAPFRYLDQESNKFDGSFVPTQPLGGYPPQQNSAHPSVEVVADDGTIKIRIEKLFLLAGSMYFREFLPLLDESSTPAVITIPGKIPSAVKFHRAVDDAKKLTDWKTIQADFYPDALGVWDVEPDMEITCDEDDTTINAHRFKLTSRFLYFELLLERERWQNAKQAQSPILPCSFSTGLKFMEFLYKKQVSEPPKTLDECVALLKLADFIMDDELRSLVSVYFKPFLNTDHILPIFRIAELYNADVLRKDCLDFMVCMLPEMSASDKQDNIWQQITSSAYPLESLPQDEPSTWARTSLINPSFDRVSFQHTDDVLPEGRTKLIHVHGSTAKVELKINPDSPYTGIFQSGGIGLARLSLAIWAGNNFVPGMALKIFVDGGTSQNFQVMNSVDGQGENRNFFAKDFTNVIPPAASIATKILAVPFRSAVNNLPGEDKDRPYNEFTLGLTEQASVTAQGDTVTGKVIAPYQLIFTPNPANGWDPSDKEDLRLHLSRIPAGTVLYTVSAKASPDGPLEELGQLVTQSGFVASEFGDKVLFFNHARKRWQP